MSSSQDGLNLDPTSQGLHLRENMNKGVFVDGLVEVIDNPSEAYHVLISPFKFQSGVNLLCRFNFSDLTGIFPSGLWPFG